MNNRAVASADSNNRLEHRLHPITDGFVTPIPRWLAALLTFGFFTLFGLLIFSYKYLDDLAREQVGTFWPRLIEEGTGTYGASLLFPLIVLFARRFRPTLTNWRLAIPAQVAGLLAFSVAHTTLNALSRWILFPLFGLGHYYYGILSIRYLMELSNDAIVYIICASVVYVFDYYRRSRDRALRHAQLETQLAQAQLQSLRLQLQPHFLFNALNTISSLIYEDVVAADAMIARLSDLLRASLAGANSQEVPLEEELAFLAIYLDVMRARFQNRLAVNLEVAPETRAALVPQFVLQPLVENSIKHAGESVSEVLKIEIFARLEDKSLILEVGDNGPGIGRGRIKTDGAGIGLSNTVERLKRLYGDRQMLSLVNRDEGGLMVKLKIPFHHALTAAEIDA